jgi:hypothetical protein
MAVAATVEDVGVWQQPSNLGELERGIVVVQRCWPVAKALVCQPPAGQQARPSDCCVAWHALHREIKVSDCCTEVLAIHQCLHCNIHGQLFLFSRCAQSSRTAAATWRTYLRPHLTPLHFIGLFLYDRAQSLNGHNKVPIGVSLCRRALQCVDCRSLSLRRRLLCRCVWRCDGIWWKHDEHC